MEYKPVRASEIKVNQETQLDRIEKKMDRILEHLENKDLSFELYKEKMIEALDSIDPYSARQ